MIDNIHLETACRIWLRNKPPPRPVTPRLVTPPPITPPPVTPPRRTTPPPPPRDWCGDLARLLGEARDQAINDLQGPIQDASRVNRPLADSQMWRAIASVTESISISDARTTRFSLFNLTELSVLRVFPTLPATHPCARPGNEAFFIRNDLSDGTVGHNTLYFLRNTHDDTFQFESYDSAKGAWHREDLQTAGNQFTQGIQAQGWYRLNPNRTIVQPVVSRDPPARQLGGWECGVYVTIYASALALGLDISQFTGFQRSEDMRSKARLFVSWDLRSRAS
jgi:hypothetical protein